MTPLDAAATISRYGTRPTTQEAPALQFLKVHGTGNDFVLLPDLQDRLTLTAGLARALADRHRGIGGDGVIRMGAARTSSGADVFMDYRNADGSLAEMCGNGVRTVARYLADRRGLDTVAVDTRAGVKHVEVIRDDSGWARSFRVDMGAPEPGDVERPLALPDGSKVAVTTVSMGNPHAVLTVPDVAVAPVTSLGPAIATHEAFPAGTNVEFITVKDRNNVHGRIWERGVGETLASGTGGSAMAVAAAMLGLAAREVEVHLPGGSLGIRWSASTLHVTGPAVEVATGYVDDQWLAEAQRSVSA